MIDINEALDVIRSHAPITGYRLVPDDELIDEGLIEEVLTSDRIRVGTRVLNDSTFDLISDVLQDHGICQEVADDISIRIVMALRK
uniref:Uncharacterized protein n=1 Tax=Ochrobactrum phage ORM_20 TaxID=2985243 RepID=A0A9N6ZGK4_9VIRU|nr:hypothetical protein ORM20_00247 [Ochrobactrum phage ORM_20]